MLSISPEIYWQPVPGEVALFDARDGGYHVLNGTAAEIWRHIAAGNDLPRIHEALRQTFDAPDGVIEEEVEAFVTAATAKGLIVARDPDEGT